MTDFTFSDLSRVHWASTLKLAAGRGFTTGAIFGVLFLVLGFAGAAQGQPKILQVFGMALAAPFLWTVGGPLLAIFYWFVGWAVGKFVPFLGGIIALASALVICWGDPIIYVINRKYPRLFNIADLKFINFRPMIFITS